MSSAIVELTATAVSGCCIMDKELTMSWRHNRIDNIPF